MIDQKDYSELHIAFPDIDSNLAYIKHKYICHNHTGKCCVVECESFRPHSPRQKRIRQFVIVQPARNNPFRKVTLIDCDTSYSIIDDHLRRDGIINDLIFEKVRNKISSGNLKEIILDEEKVQHD